MSTNPEVAQPDENTYDVAAIEARWPAVWDELRAFAPADDGSRERRYVLDMFPYPSGDLHMVHAEAFAIHARWLRERPGDYAQLTRSSLLTGAFLTA